MQHRFEIRDAYQTKEGIVCTALTWQTVVEDLDVIGKVSDITGIAEASANIVKLAAFLSVTQQLDGQPVLWTVIIHQLSAVIHGVRRTAVVGASEAVWIDVLAVDG